MSSPMISMTKGHAPVSLGKPKRIRVRATWPPTKDYDLGAEVLYQDGTSESIAAFGAGPRHRPASRTATEPSASSETSSDPGPRVPRRSWRSNSIPASALSSPGRTPPAATSPAASGSTA